MKKELDVMEELWQVKKEIASKFANVRDFCEALMKYQAVSHAKFAV